MLRKMFSLMLLSLFVISSIQAEWNESQEKFYCSSQQIEVQPTSILVYFDNKTVEVDALYVDERGIYMYEENILCPYCRKTLNPKNTCENTQCN